MSASPLVSVVVPTFNQGHYLPIALDSLMFQDYPDLEIIICNHGSTDDTHQVLEKYMDAIENEQVNYLSHLDDTEGQDNLVRKYEKRFKAERRIKIVQSRENIGGTNSYNEGFKRAKGKYCTYLVADDYFFPTALREMVETLEATNADIAYSDMLVVDDQGRILQKLEKPDYSFQACFADWFHLGVGRLYRRNLHEHCGYYNPEYRNANDYDMFLRFAMSGASFVHIPKVLYCTRKHYPDNPNEPASWRNNGYRNLLRECTICAKRARVYLKEKKSD